MENKKLLKYPLNIQLFADGDNEGGNQTPQNGDQEKNTITFEEYSKLKSQFDKTSSELAKMKKEEKARMSEDEKKALELQQREAHYQELERKVLRGEMQNELINSGLDNDSISKILDTYFSEDKPDIINVCKTIAQVLKKNIDTIKENAKDEFQRGSTMPPLNDDSKTDDPFMKSLIAKKAASNSQNARDFYFKKGDKN